MHYADSWDSIAVGAAQLVQGEADGAKPGGIHGGPTWGSAESTWSGPNGSWLLPQDASS